MEINTIKLVQPPFTLFRYDSGITKPQWDDKAANPRYSYPGRGPKNSAGLFYFADSYESAERLALNAVIENEKPFEVITMTRCELTRPVNILDFSRCNNVYHMLCVLNDSGLNVMNEDFATFEIDGSPYQPNLAYLASLYAEKELPQSANRADLVQLMSLRPDRSNSYNVRLFGQRLSDFGNGKIFKELLREKRPDIDGYRWCESEKEGEYTYCFFDIDALSMPVVQRLIYAEEQEAFLRVSLQNEQLPNDSCFPSDLG